jgi:hypothetical protein
MRKKSCPTEVSLFVHLKEAMDYAADRQIPWVLAWENGLWSQVHPVDGHRIPFDKEAWQWNH